MKLTCRMLDGNPRFPSPVHFELHAHCSESFISVIARWRSDKREDLTFMHSLSHKRRLNNSQAMYYCNGCVWFVGGGNVNMVTKTFDASERITEWMQNMIRSDDRRIVFAVGLLNG